MVTIGEGRGKEIVREFGMDMYTLLYLKWITEQDPDGMGVWGRMDRCICMTESLYCVSEAITTLLIGYMPI